MMALAMDSPRYCCSRDQIVESVAALKGGRSYGVSRRATRVGGNATFRALDSLAHGHAAHARVTWARQWTLAAVSGDMTEHRPSLASRPQTAGAALGRQHSADCDGKSLSVAQTESPKGGSRRPSIRLELPTPRQRRPSSAGDLLTHAGEGTSVRTRSTEGNLRPDTAPACLNREPSARKATLPRARSSRDQQKACGASARAVEARLDDLRADDTLREELLQRVDRVLTSRRMNDVRQAWAGQRSRKSPCTRQSVAMLLRDAQPLDTGRKASLVEVLKSAGLEANRVTQTLLDPRTRALLHLRANEGRREREARIRGLVASCERRRQNERRVAQDQDRGKERRLRTRRERLQQTRVRREQAKIWLVVVKILAAGSWVVCRRGQAAENKRRHAAAEVISRHVVLGARHRYKLRLEAATRVIDDQFAKKIRRWKTKRDAQATAILLRFLSDVRSSDVNTRVKLLAFRVAHAHVQLARLQRWWRSRCRENDACRHVLRRLWENEVDARVDVKVAEMWRARHETQPSPDNAEASMRWGGRQGSSSSPGASRDGIFARGKAGRQAREEQARGERATKRSHLMLDPLVNPPEDVKWRMCAEYLKSMSLRHVNAVGEYKKRLRQIADLQSTQVKDKSSSLSISLAVQARRRILKHDGNKIAGLPTRPKWRASPSLPEIQALVDAGVKYVASLLWLCESSTPSRLDDGSFVSASMATPENLAARVARRFRHDGVCSAPVDEMGTSTIRGHAIRPASGLAHSTP